MNKLKDTIAKDLWVVLLDFVAVNLSYYLAFYFRFYVNLKLGLENAETYKAAFLGFAPWYTVICIVLFMAWRLYGGLWRYAGVNDMNRIIGANVCSIVVYVAGTALFYTRMPIAYYAAGGILQFVFVVLIRFGYRVLLVEKKRLSRGKRMPAVVIGAGENGRRVVKTLEESEAYSPVAVVGSASGTMDGIPITTTLPDLGSIKAVFIADPLLSVEQRKEIKEQCDAARVEIHEYTGFFSNLGGRLSLTELLSTVKGPLDIELDGKTHQYGSGEATLAALIEKYDVKEITGNPLHLVLEHKKQLNTQDVLKAAYVSMMGDEPLSSSGKEEKGGGE